MVLIVAEIGVNWEGNFDLVKEMMEKARDAGCNAVKFQAFQEAAVKDHPEKDRLIKSAISMANIEKIDNLARLVGIEWFCTPMYHDAVDFLEPYVKRFKIRELDGQVLFEHKSSELIERVLKTNKQVIISSQRTPKITKFFGNSRIKWLYCVPKYPCSFDELDFTNLKDFDGYSNHCPHILAPLSAVMLGARIIEVHLTSNKIKNFVDNPVSFDYKELKELVDFIHLFEKIKR